MQHTTGGHLDGHPNCGRLLLLGGNKVSLRLRLLLVLRLFLLLLLQQSAALSIFFPHRAILKELLLPNGNCRLELINSPLSGLPAHTAMAAAVKQQVKLLQEWLETAAGQRLTSIAGVHRRLSSQLLP